MQIVVYPPRRSLYDLLVRQVSGAGASTLLSAFFRPGEIRAFGTLQAPLVLFRRGEPLAFMPYAFLR